MNGYTTEQRTDLGRLAAVGLLGLLLGLFIGWVVWPVEQSNSTISDLRPDLRAHYLAALADAYVAAGGQNPEITLARLGEIENPPTAIADAIRFYQANPSAASAVAEINLRTLAAALGEEDAVMRSLQSDLQPTQEVPRAEPNMGWLPWLLIILTAVILLTGGLWIAYQLLRQRYEEAQRIMAQQSSAAESLDDTIDIDLDHQASEAERLARWRAMMGDDVIQPPNQTAPVNVNVNLQRPAAAPPEDLAPDSVDELWVNDVDPVRDDNHFDDNFDESKDFDREEFDEEGEFEDDEFQDDELEDEVEDEEIVADRTEADAAIEPNPSSYDYAPAEKSDRMPDPAAPSVEKAALPNDLSNVTEEPPSSPPDLGTMTAPKIAPPPRQESTPPALPGPATAASLRKKPLSVPTSKPAASPAEVESGRTNLQDRLSHLWRKDSADRRDNILGQFKAHYQYGIADYEESFIITPKDELLGACGMGIDKDLDPKAASSDKIHVLDVWFYDRTHLHTYNQLIVSRSMNWDKLTGKANNSGTVTGEPLVAAPGVTFKLQGKDLILDCRIDTVEYLDESDHQSPFRNVVVSMFVRKKK